MNRPNPADIARDERRGVQLVSGLCLVAGVGIGIEIGSWVPALVFALPAAACGVWSLARRAPRH